MACIYTAATKMEREYMTLVEANQCQERHVQMSVKMQLYKLLLVSRQQYENSVQAHLHDNQDSSETYSKAMDKLQAELLEKQLSELDMSKDECLALYRKLYEINVEVKKKEFELRHDYGLDKEKASRLTAVERQLQEDYFAIAPFNTRNMEAQDVLNYISKMNFASEYEFQDVVAKVVANAFDWSAKHQDENFDVIEDIEKYFEEISPSKDYYDQKKQKFEFMSEEERAKALEEEEKARQ